MCKIINIVLISSLLSLFQITASAEEGSFGLDGVFVYKDMVGGPYFDEWYVDGDLSNLRDLKFHRQGKSGTLEVPIKIDCKLETLTIQDSGLIYGHIVLTKEEAKEYLSKDISEETIRIICNSKATIQEPKLPPSARTR